jgi:hypothetical protein
MQGDYQKRNTYLSPNMPGGQKAKKVKHDRNISGLKNQSKNFPSHSDSTSHPTTPWTEAPNPEWSEVEDDLETEDDYDLLHHFDSAGHECIFLPKFHCELNPIEMVSNYLLNFTKFSKSE